MGRRYYCDYCDKSMVNTAETIKKHIRGLQHQSLRNGHYRQFEDKKLILECEMKKKPCKNFTALGQCMFGANCRYTHLTKYQIDALKYEVEQELNHKSLLEAERQRFNPSLNSWLASRKQRGLINSVILEKMYVIKSDDCNISDIMSWNVPVFESLPELPPSLRKIDLNHFKDYKPSSWG